MKYDVAKEPSTQWFVAECDSNVDLVVGGSVYNQLWEENHIFTKEWGYFWFRAVMTVDPFSVSDEITFLFTCLKR